VIIAIIGAVVAALVYLVRKTKEEDAAAKTELQQIVSSLPNDKQVTFWLMSRVSAEPPGLR